MVGKVHILILCLAALSFSHPVHATSVLTVSDGTNDVIRRHEFLPPVYIKTLLSGDFQVSALSQTDSLNPGYNSSDFGVVWRDDSSDVILGSTDSGSAVQIGQLSFLNGNDIIAFEIENHGPGPLDLFAVQANGPVPGDSVFTGSGGIYLSCLSNPANPCGTDQITGLFRFGNGELLYSLNGNSIWLRETDGTITMVADAASLGAPSGMSGLSLVSQEFINQNVVPEPEAGFLVVMSLGLLGLLQSSSRSRAPSSLRSIPIRPPEHGGTQVQAHS